ncbi:hypothetical protein GCWU000282_02658 [Catonella morbi ATCC 51271]|uniref:Uncharacterized protein n=2 Tax=Catonella TaxID=43996 RepID=V2Y380_9FIRM|nr:hypothetical protein GCWU000282_02658 [Catonella morbi ATCC 51271]
MEWIGQGNYRYSKMWKIDFAFDLFYNYLLSENVSEDNIIKIEPDQRKNYKFRNPINICECVETILYGNKDEKYYLFIDEVRLTAKSLMKKWEYRFMIC